MCSSIFYKRTLCGQKKITRAKNFGYEVNQAITHPWSFLAIQYDTIYVIHKKNK